MITESEGIILRQTKISGGRRMVSIFTKKFGKIGAGTNLNERSKGKQALALRPFTHGTYEFFKRGAQCRSTAENYDSVKAELKNLYAEWEDLTSQTDQMERLINE